MTTITNTILRFCSGAMVATTTTTTSSTTTTTTSSPPAPPSPPPLLPVRLGGGCGGGGRSYNYHTLHYPYHCYYYCSTTLQWGHGGLIHCGFPRVRWVCMGSYGFLWVPTPPPPQPTPPPPPPLRLLLPLLVLLL